MMLMAMRLEILGNWVVSWLNDFEGKITQLGHEPKS